MSVKSLNGAGYRKFLFSTLHILPPIYPIVTCVDPDLYLEYRYGSTKFLNTDPIWIRINNTAQSTFHRTGMSFLAAGGKKNMVSHSNYFQAAGWPAPQGCHAGLLLHP